MVWPPPVPASPSTAGGCATMDAPPWTQDSSSTAETGYDDRNDDDDDDHDHDHDHDDGGAWSQPPSPSWEINGNSTESPWIPSAQPVFYPFSLPASGIRPLTPPSPVQRRPDFDDNSWASDLDSDSEVQDMLDDVLQRVSGMAM